MAFRAVIFDLIGTLVPFSPDAYNAVVADMARVLTAPPFEFSAVWTEISHQRETGPEGTIESDLNLALVTLGVYTHVEQRGAAVDLMYRYESVCLTPRPDAIQLCKKLREAGLRLGAVANLGFRLARAWPDSPLASLIGATAFSCEIGARMPDVRIYTIAAERLGVATDACLFVSAGASYELEGAEQAGMRAIRIARTGMSGADPAASGAAPWKGRTIARLEQIIGIATA